MARRKRNNLIKELADSPWWVGLVAGFVGYPVLRWLLPWMARDQPLLSGLSPALGSLALVWLIACLGASCLSLLRAFMRGRLYERTRDTDDLAALSWQEFEHLVGEYFRRKGFLVRETGSAGGDGGVDVLLFRNGERSVVQCKHWKARQVGVATVRELIGTVQLTGAARGYLVTSGAVTHAAKAAARDGDVQIISAHDILNVSNKDRKPVAWPFGRRIATRRARRALAAGAFVALLALAAITLLRYWPDYIGRVLQEEVTSTEETTRIDDDETGESSPASSEANERQGAAPAQSDVRALEDGIYRWRDDQGNVVYGDSPPDGSESQRMPDNLDEQNVIQTVP